MKAGDQGWVFGTVDRVFNDGTFIVSASGICEEQDLLPDHPALPAVARWIAEHGISRDELIDIAEAAIPEFPGEQDARITTALRALLAALTTEEPA